MHIVAVMSIFLMIGKRSATKTRRPQKRNMKVSGVSVQVSALPLTAEAASLIVKKPCHFGVVSYKDLVPQHPDTRNLTPETYILRH